MRYPLANDGHGNPIEVPDATKAWRVRRANGRPGRPQNVYDPETGKQLEIPLQSTVDDLRDYGCGPGRYRLEGVDEQGSIIASVVAFTELADNIVDEPATPSIYATQITRLLDTVERQSDTLCRALEAMATAFGPVRPTAQSFEAAPMVVPAAPAGMSTMDVMQNVAGVVKLVSDSFKANGSAPASK